MSMTTVRPYFRARAKELGLTEWTDGFAFDNIPSNIINKAFHMEMGAFQGSQRNQLDQQIYFPITFRFFLKGFRDPASAIDSAILLSENLIKNCCKPENSLTQGTGLTNVIFDSGRQLPVGPSNDNLVMSELNFRAFIELALS